MTRRAGGMVVLGALAFALSGCGGPRTAATNGPDPAAKALLAALPTAYQSADLENGKLRLGLCRSCHTIAPEGADMTGPALHGVFGRKAGSRAGYSYSEAIKTSGIVWDADHLDKWLAKPREYLPGTKMTFAGLEDAKDRRDLIAYLKVASSTTP